jgi:hypothetical protein
VEIIKEGDIEVMVICELRPTTDDFLLWEIVSMSPLDRIFPVLAGDDEIILKLWQQEEGQGNPTEIRTGLRWTTFDMDENILILTKQGQMRCCILVTKNKVPESQTLYLAPDPRSD